MLVENDWSIGIFIIWPVEDSVQMAELNSTQQLEEEGLDVRSLQTT